MYRPPLYYIVGLKPIENVQISIKFELENVESNIRGAQGLIPMHKWPNLQPNYNYFGDVMEDQNGENILDTDLEKFGSPFDSVT